MIQIDHITLGYAKQTLLRDFSLSVNTGQKVALCGPSGAGKSSILRCILGFVRPQTGRIVIDGAELDRHNVWTLRRRIGYVPQEADLADQLVSQTIRRPFSFRANARLRPNLDRLPQMLRQFGLSDAVLDKEMPALSGGEKQRIALIITLLLDRDLLLFDEISSALDERSTETIAAMIRESSSTILLVTHDRRLTAVCDRVVDIPSLGQAL